MACFSRQTSSSGKVIHRGLGAFAILYLLVVGFVLFNFPAYAATPAEQGQAIFEQKCQGCHTIGGARLVGPDLKGVTASRDRDWLIRFITTPDKLIAQGDPIAQQLVAQYGGMAMPNMGLTEEQAKAVLSYIEAQSEVSKTPSPSVQNTNISAPPVLLGGIRTGRDIFTGKIPLQNGGPSCISCHNISGIGAFGGGTVGKDLTGAFNTLGEQGITAILKTTPFPIMKEIYTEKPLTSDERAQIVAFLRESGSSSPSTASQNPSLFFIIGGASALLIIGLFQWLWRGRLSGVRRTLVKGGSK